MDTPVLFSEKQRFQQWWIWAILLVINGIVIFDMIWQVVLAQQPNNKLVGDMELILISSVFMGFTVLFFMCNLRTRITADGIDVRLFPVHLTFKHYSWTDIEKAYVREYSPIREYGGWGLRYSITGAGKAYNISGNMGLQLELKSGKKLLIGTKKAEELSALLENIKIS